MLEWEYRDNCYCKILDCCWEKGTDYCTDWKGLYFLREFTRPSIDPAAATSDTIRQAKLNMFNHVHGKENFRILVRAMYISTGKYTVNGQKDAAPMRPKKSLKNGKIMATTAVTIT